MSVRLLLGSLTIAALAGTGASHAADYLRGAYAQDALQKSEGIDWAGAYAGGYVGYSSAQMDASGLRGSLAREAMPNSTYTGLLESTINLRKTTQEQTAFGGFAGVNYLWDDVVLGLEVDYTRSSFSSSTTAGPYGLTRTTGTVTETVTSTTTARARVREWGTLRGRVGWAAGYFMPYLTVGIALGNIDGRASTTGSWERDDTSAPPPTSGTFASSVGRRGIAYGGTVGAGVDMTLFSNIFLRAEWQYIQFSSSGGRPEVSINTARVGGGVKF
ncbi:MAG: porin family protein [Methylobacterium sp.]|nr:porin family protein [Methylobacterium sp.]MCA3600470.1 porin family protein [Methylobacterium sp.]MCA3605879.1 porin family protein [Methylobacterium sp.]MCA3610606.1 porin family protein [Methylobacterium sp.]MCA3618256.1 porin family protein [Methylobacterium sp.]